MLMLKLISFADLRYNLELFFDDQTDHYNQGYYFILILIVLDHFGPFSSFGQRACPKKNAKSITFTFDVHSGANSGFILLEVH